MKLAPYVREPNSFTLYVRNPRPVAVHFQHTEFGGALLDLELAYADETAGQGKVLLRLEGAAIEMRVLAEAIAIAIETPRPHPSPADLFESALIDRSGGPETMREFYEAAERSQPREVSLARTRLQRCG